MTKPAETLEQLFDKYFGEVEVLSASLLIPAAGGLDYAPASLSLKIPTQFINEYLKRKRWKKIVNGKKFMEDTNMIKRLLHSGKTCHRGTANYLDVVEYLQGEVEVSLSNLPDPEFTLAYISEKT